MSVITRALASRCSRKTVGSAGFPALIWGLFEDVPTWTAPRSRPSEGYPVGLGLLVGAARNLANHNGDGRLHVRPDVRALPCLAHRLGR